MALPPLGVPLVSQTPLVSNKFISTHSPSQSTNQYMNISTKGKTRHWRGSPCLHHQKPALKPLPQVLMRFPFPLLVAALLPGSARPESLQTASSSFHASCARRCQVLLTFPVKPFSHHSSHCHGSGSAIFLVSVQTPSIP